MVKEMLGKIKISTNVATEHIIATFIPGVNHFSQVLCAWILLFGFQKKIDDFICPCSVKGGLSSYCS